MNSDTETAKPNLAPPMKNTLSLNASKPKLGDTLQNRQRPKLEKIITFTKLDSLNQSSDGFPSEDVGSKNAESVKSPI